MVNSPALDTSFAALAHPIRRGIVERLAQGPATVGEATGEYPVSKPAISRHLRVLEEAGLILRVIDGRAHRLSLGPQALAEPSAWLARQRELWQRKFEVVDEYLRERQASDPPRKDSK